MSRARGGTQGRSVRVRRPCSREGCREGRGVAAAAAIGSSRKAVKEEEEEEEEEEERTGTCAPHPRFATCLTCRWSGSVRAEREETGMAGILRQPQMRSNGVRSSCGRSTLVRSRMAGRSSYSCPKALRSLISQSRRHLPGGGTPPPRPTPGRTRQASSEPHVKVREDGRESRPEGGAKRCGSGSGRARG